MWNILPPASAACVYSCTTANRSFRFVRGRISSAAKSFVSPVSTTATCSKRTAWKAACFTPTEELLPASDLYVRMVLTCGRKLVMLHGHHFLALDCWLCEYLSYSTIPETMRHTLHSHIIYLEHMIQSLTDRLTASHLTTDDRESIGSQIYHAQRALEHYRKAYAHELTVFNPEAPGSPRTNSEGQSGNPTGSKSERNKKDGPAAFVSRARRKTPIRLPGTFATYHGSACARLP
jgi:hypothetical protein